MRIAIVPSAGDATVLATDAAVVDSHAAPQSDLHLAEEATVQESKPIGAERRSMFNRKNAGGTLSFAVRPKYSTLELAAAGVFTLAGRRCVAGTLKVWANGVYQNSSTAATVTRSGAIIQKAEARQIGVTVEVKYEIVF